MLYVNPQILIVAEIMPVGVVAADSALQFHVEATIPLGGEGNTNDIASISDRKAGELAIAKTGRPLASLMISGSSLMP